MNSNSRLSIGIPELDELLLGGLITNSTTLVVGPPGTGKTTLGLSFILEGLKKKEPGLIITFEEFPEIYYRDAANYGWDLKKYEEEGLLKIIFTSPQIFLMELEKEMGLIDRFSIGEENQRILLDPVTYFHFVEKNPKELRDIYNRLVNSLRRAKCTSLFTCELNHMFGNLRNIGTRMPFVVDNIIVLTYFESNSSIKRALNVIKTRGSKHQNKIVDYKISDEGIVMGSGIDDKEGIMTGSPRTILRKFMKYKKQS